MTTLTRLVTSISAVLMSRRGTLTQIAETYSVCDSLKTQLNCTKEYAIEPVGGSNVKVIDFVDMVKAGIIMIKTNKPLFITLTFAPSAPIPPMPVPTVDLFVKELMYITTEVTAITLTNPNAGTPGTDDATVTVAFIGD